MAYAVLALTGVGLPAWPADPAPIDADGAAVGGRSASTRESLAGQTSLFSAFSSTPNWSGVPRD